MTQQTIRQTVGQAPRQASADPITRALLDALATVDDQCAAAELRHLESWRFGAPDDLAGLLWMRQLRRANPDLAAAIRAEMDAIF